jgi:C4-dicarboxylate-specific signal transduction histidine kinase
MGEAALRATSHLRAFSFCALAGVAQFVNAAQARPDFTHPKHCIDGIWNQIALSKPIVAQPPFGQTYWFWGGAVLLPAGAGLLLTWWVHCRSRRRLDRMQRQSATIVRLSLSGAMQGDNLKTALRDVTESSARVLGIEYASVWLLDEAAGELRCAAEFDATSAAHREGMVLAARDYQRYLERLGLHRSIVANDVFRDPRTVECAQNHLGSRRIASSLDAAVRVTGKLVGVVCQHDVRQRSWHYDEVAFVCAVADHVSQVLLNEERKKAESELARQRSELARLSRVAALTELFGSLAHELSQPLTAILANAAAAQTFLSPTKQDLNEVQSILEDITSDDRRAAEVIGRLRVLFQKSEMLRRPLDVNELVRETLKLVRGDLASQSVLVEAELTANLPMVNGDQVQLQQVLLNLLANGCEAMAEICPSERKLTVRTEADGNGSVKISVVDRGCGIVQQQMESMFTPFFTTKEGGTGLGLAVCRSIVSAHGGKVWAANEPPRGARLNILLPAAAAK